MSFCFTDLNIIVALVENAAPEFIITLDFIKGGTWSFKQKLLRILTYDLKTTFVPVFPQGSF